MCKKIPFVTFVLALLVFSSVKAQKSFDVQSYNIIDTVGPYKSALHLVRFSPNSKYVAGSGEDNNIVIWNADSNKVYKTLKGHKGRINSMAYSNDGSYLATASSDGTVILWDIVKAKPLKTFSPNGIAPGKGKKINFVCFGKDDKELLFGGDDNSVTKIRNPFTTANSSKVAGTPEAVITGVCSPDRKFLGFSSGGLIYILNIGSNDLKVIAGTSDAVTSLAFRPDNKIIAAKCKDRNIEFWDLHSTSNKVKSIKPEYDNKSPDYSQIQYSLDGKYLCTGSIDNMPQMWDMDDYKLVYTLKGHEGPVPSIDFSRDGRLIATASHDATIKIWYLEEAVLFEEANKKFNSDSARAKRVKKGYNDSTNLESQLTYSGGNLPLTLNGRKITASHPVEVASKTVSLYVWDDDVVDGDIISLNFNGNWVLSNYKLTKKKRVVNITLDEKGNNFLLLYAHNEGDTPPNTAGISIYDGYKETRLIMKSDLKSCDAIRLKLK